MSQVQSEALGPDLSFNEAGALESERGAGTLVDVLVVDEHRDACHDDCPQKAE